MNKYLILLSPLVMIPMIVICIGLNMPSILVVFGLALYIYVLLKTLSN